VIHVPLAVFYILPAIRHILLRLIDLSGSPLRLIVCLPHGAQVLSNQPI